MNSISKRPIIGITVDVEDDLFVSSPGAYMSVVEAAGGLPIIIPYYENDDTIKELVDLCDGFLFSGGNDISPERYGEETLPVCGEMALKRDDLEFRMLDEILKTDKPILAVCRGAQFINVAFGGTLYQDISSQLKTELRHKQSEPKFAHSHSVNIRKGTPLYSLMGCDRIAANSFHHQAIKDIGEGLEVMAESDDGIVEALYYTGGRYIRAYQWHPERLCAIDEHQRRLFSDFINACGKDRV